MKILEVLTYYRPHVSGLTIYVERLSKALAAAGHDVTILTSQYDASLARHETLDNVEVIRIPVVGRVSKGVLMPLFGPRAWQLVPKSDVVHLHLPQFDAPGVALRGRLFGKPVVLTYHSDLMLPPGKFNRFVEGVVSLSNRAAGWFADAVVTYTQDFGRRSPFLSRYVHSKLHVIPPPVELASVTDAQVAGFRHKHGLTAGPVIGIAARLAAEKGVEILLKALPMILEAFPEATVLHAGPTTEVMAEEAYAARLAPLFERHQQHYKLLGNLDGSELTAFYHNLDCLVLCSLNNTETFGLVQIEAMMSGAPVVASDLPGVRQPVKMTGMGEIAPVADPRALADRVIAVLADKSAYLRSPRQIAAAFSPAQTAAAYVDLFTQLLRGQQPEVMNEPQAYEQLRAMQRKLGDQLKSDQQLENQS